MEKMLRMKGIKAIVVVVVLHMVLGFGSARVFAQQAGEVIEGSQTDVIPDGGDVQANHEAAQALVDAQNQMLEDVGEFQTQSAVEEESVDDYVVIDDIDNDGDGIPDEEDETPDGPDSEGDIDGDGEPDEVDPYPELPGE